MYSFMSDYSEGAHPRILEALISTNMEQSDGYSIDTHCLNASRSIQKILGCGERADVHFFTGGTQTNLTAISTFLRPHHGIISADSGHIFTHETGAIEASGHKVIATPTTDGKIMPEQILQVLKDHKDEHMVKPKLVYISNSTEIGSVYTKAQLQALSAICHENNLYLYMDGARLATALTSSLNDLVFEDLPRLLDAFYIGGTKNGALFGEALVICKDELKEDFRYHMKQRGGLFAKGRLLGIQFEELFKEDLFFTNGRHANRMASLLQEGIAKLGYSFFSESPTNQIFPIFPNSIIAKLEEQYNFLIWNELDKKKSTVRLVTSWATEELRIFEFLSCLKGLSVLSH